MTGFERRMALAVVHENKVFRWLLYRGWHVDKIGQSQLSVIVREAIRAIVPKCPLRFWPDLFAVRRLEVWQYALIDAKAGKNSTHRNIETAVVEAHELFQEAFRLPIYYVFSDMTVATVQEVRDNSKPGTWSGNGSGTPYGRFPSVLAHPFDTIFGAVKRAGVAL